MSVKEMYVSASELKKGDFLDHQEVLSKRKVKSGFIKLKVQGTVTGNITEFEISPTKYVYITRYN